VRFAIDPAYLLNSFLSRDVTKIIQNMYSSSLLQSFLSRSCPLDLIEGEETEQAILLRKGQERNDNDNLSALKALLASVTRLKKKDEKAEEISRR